MSSNKKDNKKKTKSTKKVYIKERHFLGEFKLQDFINEEVALILEKIK